MSKLVKIGKISSETRTGGWTVIRPADGSTQLAICTTTGGGQVTAYHGIGPINDANLHNCMPITGS